MKAWVIFERIKERNLDFVEKYRIAAASSVAEHHGKYLTVSFQNPLVEGPGPIAGPKMIAIKEFVSRQAAEQWFESPEYKAARKLREGGVTNRAMIIDVTPPSYALRQQSGTTPAISQPSVPAWIIFERLEERSLDFVPEYRKVAAASVARFGGQYQTVSFQNQVIEGPDIGEGPNMISIIGFGSRRLATAWFNSPEYNKALEIRRAGVTNRAVIIDVIPPDYAAKSPGN